MRLLAKAWTRLTITFLLLGCMHSLVGCRRDTGADRPTVVVYCSVDQQIAEPILKAFENKYGISVKARYDTEASKTVGLIQRLRAEKEHPVADVFWSSEVFYTIRLAREGCFSPFEPERAKGWPSPFADPNGHWYGFALRHRVLAYHTERVTSQEAPQSLEDLLDPRWRGRIVMARPEFGTTGGDVASWFAHYGPERAKAILKALAENKIRLVDGNSTAVRMVATGQADVCMTDTDDVYAAQRNSWPVAMCPLNQDGKGALAIPNTAALIHNSPHPKPAQELMSYLLSDEVETQLAQSDSHNTPLRAPLPNDFPAASPVSLPIDYPEIADQLALALSSAKELLP